MRLILSIFIPHYVCYCSLIFSLSLFLFLSFSLSLFLSYPSLALFFPNTHTHTHKLSPFASYCLILSVMYNKIYVIHNSKFLLLSTKDVRIQITHNEILYWDIGTTNSKYHQKKMIMQKSRKGEKKEHNRKFLSYLFLLFRIAFFISDNDYLQLTKKKNGILAKCVSEKKNLLKFSQSTHTVF